MRILTEEEMRGFLSNLDRATFSTEPEKRREERVRAVVEHFFTHVLYHDMPSEYGLKIAENLLRFIELAGGF